MGGYSIPSYILDGGGGHLPRYHWRCSVCWPDPLSDGLMDCLLLCFYHPRMLVGNVFSHVCLFVCLSVCVSVYSGYNF